MVDLPPNWAFKIYAKLWKKFSDNKFSKSEAKKIANNSTFDQAFPKLKNHGWLKIQLDPKDSRKHLYQLKNPQEAIKEVIDTLAQDK